MNPADLAALRGHAGRALTGNWRKDPALRALRRIYRRFKKEPRGSPLREAIEQWEADRAKTGPEFAVPQDWKPGRSRPRWSRKRK